MVTIRKKYLKKGLHSMIRKKFSVLQNFFDKAKPTRRKKNVQHFVFISLPQIPMRKDRESMLRLEMEHNGIDSERTTEVAPRPSPIV